MLGGNSCSLKSINFLSPTVSKAKTFMCLKFIWKLRLGYRYVNLELGTAHPLCVFVRHFVDNIKINIWIKNNVL